MVQWRYYAERVLTNEWLDRDLRLRNVEITWALSGPGSLTATVDEDLARALGADGDLLLDEWSTAIYAEADGLIRWGGIVRRSEAADTPGDRDIEVVGFAGYPKGRVFDSEYAVWATDSFDIVRFLWNYVQTGAHCDIGIEVSNAESGVPIGDSEPPPKPVKKKNETQEAFDQRMSDWEEASGEQYMLNWWETPDIGDEIDSLMSETPADYFEVHTWSDSEKSAVDHKIELSYPGRGVRRLDLRFAEGENIALPLLPSREGDEYANNVIVLGAGEGRDTLRRTAGFSEIGNNRVRRDRVVGEKDVANVTRLKSIADAELDVAINLSRLEEITVFNHPNAVVGSWDLGDEIFIQGFWAFEQVADWFRVTSWSIHPEEGDTAVIELVKA